MPTVRGKREVDAYFAQTPAKLTKLLRGAARAGAKVISEEIKDRTPSQEVRDGLRTRATTSDGRIVVRIDVKPGWARSLGTWLEWGTDPHFIRVDDGQRDGRSVERINQQVREAGGDGSLVIGGQFVGRTVWHPGARAEPAFRPALDIKGDEAVAEAQRYINSGIVNGGIIDAGTAEQPE